MKKTVLTIAMLSLAAGAFAQKANIRTAQDYLSDNNYRKALPVIEEAVANDATKANPDAWFLRGHTYLMQANDSTGKQATSVDESLKSFNKALELKPDYEPQKINADMQNLAIIAYQEGIAYYNKADYAKAYDRFMVAVSLYNTGGGKRFAGNKQFREIAISAKQNAALCAQNAQRNDDALRLLMELRNEQSPKDSNTYFSIVQMLDQQKKYDELLPVLNEGLAAFPNSKMLRTYEINYYINAGKTDQLLPKLEAAAQNDPTNADLQFMIGNINERLSFPKDGSGNAATRPANAAETFAKAETAYKNAININGENAEYSYNMGVLYYEVAVEYNKDLNNIKGTTAADKKKYEDILAKRNAQFVIAQPYFERSYALLNAKESSLTDAEKRTYLQTMTGLLEIYTRQNNKAKADELRKKVAAMR